MKVVSFSLFGDNPKYTIGLLRNLQLAEEIYPDWYVYVFTEGKYPKDFYEKAHFLNDKVVFIEIDKELIGNRPGMLWRFLINDFPMVDRFIVRDTDSRISVREREAVDEWIENKKRLHVMRDHIHHGNGITKFEMFGGMWGLLADVKLLMIDEVINNIAEGDLYKRMDDMRFLQNVIYSRYKNNMIIHSSIENNFEGETDIRPFPSPMVDYRFVGEIINADESREPQYKLWENLKEVR